MSQPDTRDTTESSAHEAVRAARRDRARRVVTLLRHEYGSAKAEDDGNPTDSLIGTILSQHTADRNSHAAFRALKERYETPDDVATADRRELADTIRCAGLANIKAARIQETLRALHERYGTMDLGFLKALPMGEAHEILRSLPGVGPKTAACVLLFACNQPALPVDTHVHRVAGRLGLIGPRDSAERAHVELASLVPHDAVYDFHVLLIRHGRQVCKAQHPRCGVCVLQRDCEYFRRDVMPAATGSVNAADGPRL